MENFHIDTKKEITIVLFYSKTCPHCKVFLNYDDQTGNGIWKNIYAQLKDNVNVLKIENMDDKREKKIGQIVEKVLNTNKGSKDYNKYFQSLNQNNGVPTLKKIVNKKIIEYTGEREKDNIVQWVLNNPPHIVFKYKTGGSKKTRKVRKYKNATKRTKSAKMKK